LVGVVDILLEEEVDILLLVGEDNLLEGEEQFHKTPVLESDFHNRHREHNKAQGEVVGVRK